jgi:hypothetical protein
MNTIHTEVLSAFVDGEPVDPSLLSAALDDPEARAALVDFVRFRAAARADTEALPPALERLRQRTPPHRSLRWTAAEAVLVLMFVAGLLTPQPWRRSQADSDTPPQPTRIERFEPGVDWHPGD